MKAVDRINLLMSTGLFTHGPISLSYTEKSDYGYVDLKSNLHQFMICRFVIRGSDRWWHTQKKSQTYSSLEIKGREPIIKNIESYECDSLVPTEIMLEQLPLKTKIQLLFHLDLLC